jgi:CRISPR system Cascade subunit CasE
MFLNRIHLDPKCREARLDLSDPYQLHATLCRAFAAPDNRCPEGLFLWRLEPEIDSTGCPRILVQSQVLPNWSNISIKGWLAKTDAAIDLNERLSLDSIIRGQYFRFRLRANPCVTREGKRKGLLKQEEQEKWMERQAYQHGFLLPQGASFDLSEDKSCRVDVRISHELMLTGRKHSGQTITLFSVLYDGILSVKEPSSFTNALKKGIGHGKSMGLGMLSVAPVQ